MDFRRIIKRENMRITKMNKKNDKSQKPLVLNSIIEDKLREIWVEKQVFTEDEFDEWIVDTDLT